MKMIMYLLLLFTLMAATLVEARLGETKEECDSRYGKPSPKAVTPGADAGALYDKEGIGIYVEFIKNRCVCITYHRFCPNFTQAEITTFFNANGGITRWANYSGGKSNEFLRSGDGALAQTDPSRVSFSIRSWPEISSKAVADAKKKQEQDAKKRFQRSF